LIYLSLGTELFLIKKSKVFLSISNQKEPNQLPTFTTAEDGEGIGG